MDVLSPVMTALILWFAPRDDSHVVLTRRLRPTAPFFPRLSPGARVAPRAAGIPALRKSSRGADQSLARNTLQGEPRPTQGKRGRAGPRGAVVARAQSCE